MFTPCLSMTVILLPLWVCAAPAATLQVGKTVKEIRIGELRYTDRDVIERELTSKVGKPFDQRAVEEDFKRLDRLGIFSSVEIRPVEEADGVILDIRVTENFPCLPLISIEVTDENGLAAGPGFRSVNLSGRAISFSAAARFGGTTNVDVGIENPWFAGDHISYRADFARRERFNDLDNFDELSYELGLRLGSYLGKDGRIGGRLGLRSVTSDHSGVTLSADNQDVIPTLAWFAGYDTRDRPTAPRRGWWNEVDVAKNGGFLGGDGDFWTFTLDVRRYQPVGTKHTVALSSLATLQTGEMGQDIPWHQDFHVGGANTVRGWDLGSRNGKSQFLATAEYRHTIMEPRSFSVFSLDFFVGLQAAAFVDAGLAWDESRELALNESIGGYGLGLRILVPFVNMIRVDFAWGQPGGGMSFYMAIWEKAIMQRARVR